MEAFHLKRPTPVESLSVRRSRRTEIKRGCDSGSEIGAGSLGCSNKRAIPATTKILTTSTTLEETTLASLTLPATATTSIAGIPTTTTTTSGNTNTITTPHIQTQISTLPLPQISHTLIALPTTTTTAATAATTSLLTSLSPLLTSSKASSYFSSSLSTKNLWSCFYLRHDLTCIMMTMLFVISIVLSGNSALAAQRESFKPKDAHSLSSNNNNNANAIFNEIGSNSGSSSSGGSLAGNTLSNTNTNSNANNISNGNSHVNGSIIQKTTTSLSTSTSTSSSTSTASSSGGGGYATTTSSHTTSSTSSSSGSSSSSSHKTSSAQRNSIELQESQQNGPYFDKAASKNVTALLGKTAYLNCRVKNLGNKTMLLQVSWVRHRDIHLLTVGRYTYTSDQRFRAIHQPQTEDWILQIKYPQHRDSGIYECQVSTTPHMSHYIHLNVVEPSTEIIGAPDLYIESGSTINLTCVILNSPEPPAYIFWNHNNAIINYDSPRGGVSVVTNKGETTTSFLLIKSARPSDSGHYQCNPSNAKPKSVTVHVLNGVSHSVSRGIPSSNAARGTSTSSNVSKSLYLSVPVNVLVYLSICQALHKATGCSAWSKICGHLIEMSLQLLGFLLLTIMAAVVKVLRRNIISKQDTKWRGEDEMNDMRRSSMRRSSKSSSMCEGISSFHHAASMNASSSSSSTCCYYMQLRENYHMSRTEEVALIFSITNTLTIKRAIVKNRCKRQSLSTPSLSTLSSYSFSSSSSSSFSSMSSPFKLSPAFRVSFIVFFLVDIWSCYLLYSKEFSLFKKFTNSSSATNAKATATTTTSNDARLLSSSSSYSASSYYSCCYSCSCLWLLTQYKHECPVSLKHYICSCCNHLNFKTRFCLQSSLHRFFTESDIR